jgi:predicted nucleic acid-binding protein
VATDTRVVPLPEISRLAIEHRITTYDAAYLELAARLGCLLATRDKALRVAANKAGLRY